MLIGGDLGKKENLLAIMFDSELYNAIRAAQFLYSDPSITPPKLTFRDNNLEILSQHPFPSEEGFEHWIAVKLLVIILVNVHLLTKK